jgi:hypothetical protein
MTTSPPGSQGPASFPPPELGFVDLWFSDDGHTDDAPDDEDNNVVMRQLTPQTATLTLAGNSPTVTESPPPRPGLMLQTALTFGGATDEGLIVQAVGPAWRALLTHYIANPQALHDDWRKLEEIVAAAYKDFGYEVELTPRSGDRGRDVIATKRDIVTVRVFDQVKAYPPGNLVKRHDVDALLGVLTRTRTSRLAW